LQHRGQEGSGLAASEGHTVTVHRGSGLVSQVQFQSRIWSISLFGTSRSLVESDRFPMLITHLKRFSVSNYSLQIFTEETMQYLRGHMAIGHTRYSTVGASTLTNTQPFLIETVHGPIAMAHNGQLAMGKTLRKNLMEKGVGMFTSSDSEVIVQSIAAPPTEKETNGPNWVARIRRFMQTSQGSYSVVLLTKDGLFAFRDPLGMRPLCLGKFTTTVDETRLAPPSHSPPPGQHPFVGMTAQKSADGKVRTTGWIVASESCAFATTNAEFVRDVRPGEIVKFDNEGLHSYEGVPAPEKKAMCVFEYVYFARPDSIIEGRLVHHVRQRIGMKLAQEHLVKEAGTYPTPHKFTPIQFFDHGCILVDIVVGVPDSSTPMAIGYSQQSGIPFTEGLIKNRYIQRTFIQPDQGMRVEGVALKYNPLSANLKGKKVVLVDDSIVRGTTIRKLISMLRHAGAKEIHVRIGSPPIKHPCFMGVDMKSTDELVAANCTVDEVRKFIGADSLAYLSHDLMIQAVHEEADEKTREHVINQYCSACFSGNYPLDVDEW
jgi:amidophosphoribosyltransferase